jgi:hypothetical protein
MLIFFHGTQSRVHRKGLLSNRIHSYPKNLKVNDNDDDTIVNLNVPKNGNDIVIPSFFSLILMDKNTKKIIH